MPIFLKNLYTGYGNYMVLEDINVKLNEGTVYGLIGKNGAGKTTLIRNILGVIPPMEGSISSSPRSLLDSKKIAYLPEDRGLNMNLTVYYHLYYIAQLRGIKKSEFINLLDDWLLLFELMDKKNDKIKTLSKGNKQKVLIIMTFFHNPRFLILDEPFDGLDPNNSKILRDLIVKYKKKHKSIVLISSHNLRLLEDISDAFLLLENKKLLEVKNRDLSNASFKNILYKIIVPEKIEDELNKIEYIRYIKREENILYIELINEYYADKFINMIKNYNILGFFPYKRNLEDIYFSNEGD